MNLHPILSDWLREQAQHNGTTEEWELNFALTNYIATVDPDWRDAEIQTVLAGMERRDPDLEPEFGLPCDGDAIMQ
jgi:hypothetical protein